jgi:hypothetical protein
MKTKSGDICAGVSGWDQHPEVQRKEVVGYATSGGC